MLSLNIIIFGNTLLMWIIVAAIIFASLVLGKVMHYVLSAFGKRLAKKTKSKFDDIVIDILEEPLFFFITLAGIYTALNILELPVQVYDFLLNAVKVAFTIDIAWFVVRIADAFISHFLAPLAAKAKSDISHIIPVLRKSVKVIIIILTALIIIQNFGYNISSVLAGLGIGGLAFALAAKDMLANLFGGVSILADRPFKVGDRIRISDYDGWIKEIGMRSTRLETLDGTQVVIPNSKIADSVLENVSAERARKVKMKIGVTYDTSNRKMEQAVRIIEKVVKENKDTENRSLVSFIEFGDFSLNILVIYWIKSLDNILNAKHNVNMAIKKGFEKAAIGFAFPTQTIELVRKR